MKKVKDNPSPGLSRTFCLLASMCQSAMANGDESSAMQIEVDTGVDYLGY